MFKILTAPKLYEVASKLYEVPLAPPNLLPNIIGQIWPDFYVVWTIFPG